MKSRKLIKQFFIFLMCMVVVTSICSLWLYHSFKEAPPSQRYPNGPNAIWARHMWVGERHEEKEYRKFFDLLKKNHISDVYFHVGPWLEEDGGISEQKYAYADELVQNARAMYPELRIHAWIGQMTTEGGGPLELSDANVRSNIIKSSTIFLSKGFDGIHYDFEPIYSGNRDFFVLLNETKRITDAENRLLSVAAGQVEIIPGSERLIKKIAPKASIWTEDYYIQVAERVDQVAVMLYDTALPTDWLYGMYVKEQTETLVPLLENITTLFIGIPTYEENRPGHRPWAENIHTAIKGIHYGLKDVDGFDSTSNFGVALFAEWTTDEIEWKTYRTEWLGEYW